MAAPYVRALVALTALAAALRFPTLGVQSYWFDEAVTVKLLDQGFFRMLGDIPASESTPPLYYALAWVWSQVFGTGEAGLRSLSALAGTALVPVAFAAGRALVSSRVGLWAAAIVAVNPFLIWYSQEARSYALLTLLSGVSLLYFARSRRDPSAANLLGLAVASALALATHYFAVFLVAPQALWLLARPAGPRRQVAAAVAGIGVVGLALAPLAVDQASNDRAGFIESQSLVSRIAQVPKQLLIGYDAPAETAAGILAVGLAAAGVWLLVARGSREERGRAVVPAVLAAVSIGVPLLLAAATVDYLIARNVIFSLLPAAVVLGAGYAAGRAGLAAGTALCALSVAVAIVVASEPRYQRDDWRGAAEAIGPAHGPRAVVVTPGSGRVPLELYRPGLRGMPPEGARVRELVLIGLPERQPGIERSPPEAKPGRPLEGEGFRLVEVQQTDTYTLERFEARDSLTQVTPGQLAFNRLGKTPGAVLLDGPR